MKGVKKEEEENEKERIRDKFKLAKKLENKIHLIRKIVKNKIENATDEKELQKYIVIYLIDKMGIRIGNENDRGTYGCCTLEKQHVEIKEDDSIRFKFIGKHYIEYDKTIKLDKSVYKYIKKVKEGRTKTKKLFGKIDSSMVNRLLEHFIPDLTGKVFRTFNVNHKLRLMLRRKPENTKPEVWYKKVVKNIKEFCNHTNVGTSKENYIDHEITKEYCNKYNIDIKKLVSETILKKYEIK